MQQIYNILQATVGFTAINPRNELKSRGNGMFLEYENRTYFITVGHLFRRQSCLHYLISEFSSAQPKMMKLEIKGLSHALLATIDGQADADAFISLISKNIHWTQGINNSLVFQRFRRLDLLWRRVDAIPPLTMRQTSINGHVFPEGLKGSLKTDLSPSLDKNMKYAVVGYGKFDVAQGLLQSRCVSPLTLVSTSDPFLVFSSDEPTFPENLHGLSGSAIMDEKGNLAGIFCAGIPDRKRLFGLNLKYLKIPFS